MIGRLLRNDDVLRLIVLVTLVIVFGLLTNGVTYSPLGLRNILQQSAIVGIAAIGQAFVILTGAIDVSTFDPFENPKVNLTSLLAPDGDHPSAAGHHLIATVLFQALPRG